MKFSLSDLAYLKQIAFFRQDMVKDMLSLGFDKVNIDCIIYTDSIRNADIIQWWIDYGDDEILAGMMLEYLESKLPQ